MGYETLVAPEIHTGASLAKVEMPEDFYVLGPGLLQRGGHGIIGGLTGIGKTFILLNMIKAFLTKTAPFGVPHWTAEKCRCLLVEMELGPIVAAERVRKIFTQDELEQYGDAFQIISKPRDLMLSSPEWVTWLADYCADQNIEVLMLDPIDSFHFWEDKEGGKHVYKAIDKIADNKVATIISHHFRKPGTGRDKAAEDSNDPYSFAGAVGRQLIQDASFIMTMSVDQIWTQPHKYWTLKTRLGKTRNAGDPLIDFRLLVNKNDDRGVLYLPDGNKHEWRPLTEEEKKRAYSFPT